VVFFLVPKLCLGTRGKSVAKQSCFVRLEWIESFRRQLDAIVTFKVGWHQLQGFREELILSAHELWGDFGGGEKDGLFAFLTS
jgi:hypothetical protein